MSSGLEVIYIEHMSNGTNANKLVGSRAPEKKDQGYSRYPPATRKLNTSATEIDD
jgi:hypothetical protein